MLFLDSRLCKKCAGRFCSFSHECTIFMQHKLCTNMPTFCGRLQQSLVDQLEAAHPADLARFVVAVCSMGVRPQMVLLERLASMGPTPQFGPQLVASLHAAITSLLDSEAVLRKQQQQQLLARGRVSSTPSEERDGTRSSPGTASGGDARSNLLEAAAGHALEAPGAGAAEADFDAFVDAARAQLGSSDAWQPEVVGSSAADSTELQDDAGAGQVASSLMRYVLADDAAEMMAENE